MKRLTFLLLGLVFAGLSYAQSPVKWTFSSKKVKDNVYEVHMTATVEQGWTTYSQTTPDGGPAPTVITFAKNPLLTLDGKAKEVGEMKKKHEEAFGVDVHYYEHKVDFVQLVKVKGKAKTNVTGTVEFMVCDKNQCLPPAEVPFTVALQ